MDHFSDEEIGKLLRLKRYEQPPPEYFENFLHEFHRRQRAELLRQPLWRVALQRAYDFMFQVNVPSLTSYPVAAAAVLICAAVLTLNVVRTPEAETGTNVAQVATHDSARRLAQTVSEPETEWSLSEPVGTRALANNPLRMPNPPAPTHGRAATATPRYVLDSTPVSYEVSLRF